MPATKTGGALPAVAILLLTAVLGLVWSHVRLLWNDEFLSFYSDGVPTLAGVLRVQWRSPISLDPPTYHLLSHLAMDVVGRSATALRLPALCGFLLLQASLFLLVRRLAGYRAGLVAMLLPLLTASFRYAVEGRPYGLLLGLYASAVLCWFMAAEREPRGAQTSQAVTTWTGGVRGERPEIARAGGSRVWPLLGLALSIAVAITSHYFGVLILLPVTTGELVRTWRRRRFDIPVLGAMVLGMASVAFILPGKAALKPYQQHYYTSAVNLRNVSQGYRELFVRYTMFPVGVQHAIAALLLLGSAALLWAVVRRLRQTPGSEPRAPWSAPEAGLGAAMLALLVLPFFGYLFGKFVTHTMEVRYVIAALIPFAVGIALVLERRLASRRVFAGAMAMLVLLAIGLAAMQIRAEERKSAAILAGLRSDVALHAVLEQEPTRRLFTQSLNDFFLDGYYAPDPLVRERVTLVYDEGSEVRWMRHNTNAVTAVNLQQFAPLATATYPALLATPGALVLDYGSGWEWLRRDLCARGVVAQSLGAEAGGALFRLRGTPLQQGVAQGAPLSRLQDESTPQAMSADRAQGERVGLCSFAGQGR